MLLRILNFKLQSRLYFRVVFFLRPVILKRADITFKHVRSVPNPYTSLYFTVPQRPVTAIGFANNFGTS